MRSVIKRLQPFYGHIAGHVGTVGRFHPCGHGAQLPERLEGNTYVLVGDSHILYAPYFKPGLRPQVHVVLLIFLQTVECVKQAVGYHISLPHTSVHVHYLYSVILVATVGALLGQVHFKHVSVVGYRQYDEILPIIGSGIQLDRLGRHEYGAIILVGEIRKSARRAYGRHLRIHCYRCKVAAVSERIAADARHGRWQDDARCRR